MDRTQLLTELLNTARSLPADKLAAVLDFAGYLRQRPTGPLRPQPGSPESLLAHAGTFHFEPGELDQLTADIARMRELDLESHA
jgi:hypothetical protein